MATSRTSPSRAVFSPARRRWAAPFGRAAHASWPHYLRGTFVSAGPPQGRDNNQFHALAWFPWIAAENPGRRSRPHGAGDRMPLPGPSGRAPAAKRGVFLAQVAGGGASTPAAVGL